MLYGLKKRRGKGDYLGWIYEGIYFYKCENGEVSAFDLEKGKILSHSVASSISHNSKLPDGRWIDGKIYDYEIVSDRKIRIYSYNVKNGVKEKILEFECADGQIEENVDYIYDLDIDKDYIYCLDYLIPRRGGEILRLPRMEKTSGYSSWKVSRQQTTIFTYNRKFIFYIDGEANIHRIDKKTHEDVIISDADKIPAMDIRCTENGLYVQRFNFDVSMDYIFDYEDDSDYHERDTELGDSCDLYYMDVNGENVKQIWEGKDLD